jgi:hypothetical protein
MLSHRAEPHPDLLKIYLNDHLTGATGGVGLARRLAANASGADRPLLTDLAREIEEDRRALLRTMRALNVPVNRVKVALGMLGEKIGRLKPNGRLIRRSPLSGLVELEAMYLGVQGKAAGWRALREVAVRDERLEPADFDRLIDRAEAQAEGLERLRRGAAVRVLVEGV